MASTSTSSNGASDIKPDEEACCTRRLALATRRHRYLSQKLLQACCAEERDTLERALVLEALLEAELKLAHERRRCGCQ